MPIAYVNEESQSRKESIDAHKTLGGMSYKPFDNPPPRHQPNLRLKFVSQRGAQTSRLAPDQPPKRVQDGK